MSTVWFKYVHTVSRLEKPFMGIGHMTIKKELEEALDKLRVLEGEDFMAIASWMRQEGRAALRERGASDDNIGPCRLDIDKFGDAPLG